MRCKKIKKRLTWLFLISKGEPTLILNVFVNNSI